ncbi:MAG: right-handed parallel beta-helix repeat-containing protein, partial [Lentisphaerae bacterium]
LGIENVSNNRIRVAVPAERMNRWAREPAPWVLAYWHHDWAELREPLAGIDAKERCLTRKNSIKPRYGINPKKARWWILNMLCELDMPGEFYIDPKARLLYFIPPEFGHQKEIVLSVAENIVQARGLARTCFEFLRLEHVGGTAVQLVNCENVVIRGCRISNVGEYGVRGTTCKACRVLGCDVTNCGGGGISLNGGDRPSLTPAKNLVENCQVWHFQLRNRTYNPGISVSGVGNLIRHNLVYDTPHMAMAAGGNLNIVEYNEIFNAVYESGDAGAFYNGRDWTQRGNIVRYNYFHHISGGAGLGGMAFYMDDQHSGYHLINNLFWRCSRAVFLGGGCDHEVVRNIFLDCWRAVHLDNRGISWQKKATLNPNDTLQKRLRAMPYQSAKWRQHFPNLVNILHDDLGTPKRNRIEFNLSAGCETWDEISKNIRKYQVIRNNFVTQDKKWVTPLFDNFRRLIGLRFKDPKKVAALGIASRWPEPAGLYPDRWRYSWPVKPTIKEVTLRHDRKQRP